MNSSVLCAVIAGFATGLAAGGVGGRVGGRTDPPALDRRRRQAEAATDRVFRPVVLCDLFSDSDAPGHFEKLMLQYINIFSISWKGLAAGLAAEQ